LLKEKVKTLKSLDDTLEFE